MTAGHNALRGLIVGLAMAAAGGCFASRLPVHELGAATGKSLALGTRYCNNLCRLAFFIRAFGLMRSTTGRGAATALAAFSASAPGNQGPSGTEGRSEPTFSDLAAGIGADNEALRNLLIDAGRRVTGLDSVKDAFRDLVEPIDSVLRALEEISADNVGLSNALTDLHIAHEAVRAYRRTLEKRSLESESDNHSLRQELALVQHAARTLESDNAELASEVAAARAAIPDLERRLRQQRVNTRALSKANEILVDRADNGDKRVAELQAHCALTREKLSVLETEKRSLQTAVDQTLAENLRLSRRLTESESALASALPLVEQMETNLASAEKERAALCAAHDEAIKHHQSESYALNLRLQAMRSRASTAEKLAAEVGWRLIARTEGLRVSERTVVEATIARASTKKTIEWLTAARDALDAKVKKITHVRATLMERARSLSEAVTAREKSLARAEHKITSLTERIDQLEHDARTYRARTARRIEGLNGTLQRERATLAVVQSALETTRRTTPGGNATVDRAGTSAERHRCEDAQHSHEGPIKIQDQ
jgi:chromosome segregation ATPase